MFLEKWHDGRGSMNGLKKFLENICTFYLSGIEYHMETYDGPFAMIQSIEDLESLLEHLNEEKIHDTPIKEHPSSYLRKEEIKRLFKEYKVSLITKQDSEYGNIHDNHVGELHKEAMIEHIVEGSSHVTITENIEYLIFSQDSCNACLEIPHEETITDINTYEEVYDVYDDTPLCSSLRDEVLEILNSHNIFETKTLKDDYYE